MLGGHGGQVAVAGQARGRGQADRQAQHGVRTGPGGLAQVRQVLGHRDAGDPDVARQVLHGRRADAGPGRREHHHGRAHLRGDLHRLLRAGRSSCPRPSTSWPRTPVSTSTSTWTGPAAPSSPRSAPPTSSGTSGSPGSSRSAPRATSSGWPPSGWAGCCGGTRRTCPTTSSSTSPTSAATCRSSRSTSPGRPARSWPSTTTSSGWAGRATGDVHDACYDTGQVPGRGDRQARALRAALRRQPADRDPVGGLADPGGGGPRLHPLRHRRPAAGAGAGRYRPTR